MIVKQSPILANTLSRASFIPSQPGLLQRKCACGESKSPEDPQVLHEVLRSRNPKIQPKLKIGLPNDTYEQEADRMADQVVQMSEPSLQRQMDTEEDEETLLQTKRSSNLSPDITPTIQSKVQTLQQTSGHPLASNVRAFMEPRFGQNFSAVRLHTTGAAPQLARSLNARAFTMGNHIVFGAGEYQPRTVEGKKLLAHELTHVIQQGGGNRTDTQSTQLLRAKPMSREERQESRRNRRQERQDKRRQRRLLRFLKRVKRRGRKLITTRPGAAKRRAEKARQILHLIDSEDTEFQKGLHDKGIEIDQPLREVLNELANQSEDPSSNLSLDETSTEVESEDEEEQAESEDTKAANKKPSEVLAEEIEAAETQALSEPRRSSIPTDSCTRKQLTFNDFKTHKNRDSDDHVAFTSVNFKNKDNQVSVHFDASQSWAWKVLKQKKNFPACKGIKSECENIKQGKQATISFESQFCTGQVARTVDRKECFPMVKECKEYQLAERARLLSHEQRHLDIGCIIATLVNEQAEATNRLGMASALWDRVVEEYDSSSGSFGTKSGCFTNRQNAWDNPAFLWRRVEAHLTK